MAAGMGIRACWESAVDPFFMPKARVQALVQKVADAKKELVVPQCRGLAIASINRHKRHFTELFDLRLTDGTMAETACVAFGLDRWATVKGKAL
jgi:hypothetical protein